jgi:hypothetical protein
VPDDQRGRHPAEEEPPGERPGVPEETGTPREPVPVERRGRGQRALVGAGVVVGVVAVGVLGYVVAASGAEVNAQCVDVQTRVIVDDSDCVTPAGTTGAGDRGDGSYPVFIGTGGREYRYHYGGTGELGRPVQGGTATVPKKGTRVITTSGRTIAGPSDPGTVSRGGS